MANERAESSVSNGEEEKEEQRMEEFYSLLRGFHEARNQRRIELIMEEKEKKKTKIGRLDEGKSSWVPSFAWEDFASEIEFRKPPPIFPSGPICHKELEDGKEQKVDDDDGCLDLNLTL